MNSLDNVYAVAITISVIVACVFILKGLHLVARPSPTFRRQDTEVQMLLDERDRLLLNLNDLRYDYAVDKVSVVDRDHMEQELRAALTDVLRQLQELGLDVDVPKDVYLAGGGRYGQ